MAVDIAALRRTLNGIPSATVVQAAQLATFGRGAITQAIDDGGSLPGAMGRLNVSAKLRGIETALQNRIGNGEGEQGVGASALNTVKDAVIQCFIELNAVGEGTARYNQVRNFAQLWDDVKTTAAEEAAAVNDAAGAVAEAVSDYAMWGLLGLVLALGVGIYLTKGK